MGRGSGSIARVYYFNYNLRNAIERARAVRSEIIHFSPILSFSIFFNDFYFHLFIFYSYMHTIFGSFHPLSLPLPYPPTPSLSPLTPSLSPPPPCYPAETILPLSLILLSFSIFKAKIC
jgi:hypothetical protein